MGEPGGATIEVEVIYALPHVQTVRRVHVAPGTTIAQAIAASGIVAHHPEIGRTALQAGIYGQRKPLTTLLRDGDRIEIYRPLTADPKQARRTRARCDKTG